jgi:hypothetical protein
LVPLLKTGTIKGNTPPALPQRDLRTPQMMRADTVAGCPRSAQARP